jgi:glutathione synthase/RimK-type ligase-like ATP-grasp enzyme
MPMNILILGNSEDAHVAHMYEVLTRSGATVDYLDTRLFPTQLRMSWQPDSCLGSLTLAGGRKLSLLDIKSVFWRTISSVYVPSLKDTEKQTIAYRDSMSALRTLIQACPAKWVNSWQAYQFHQEKPLQLRAVQQIGVRIPATLISNDPNEVIEFTRSQERAIFKPVCGGAHTQFVTEAHLETQRLNKVLSLSPVTIQEYIPGTNIRTYVIGESVYSAEIRSGSLDFREDLEAELIPVELPDSIQQQSIAIAKTLRLEWTAIDWRLSPQEEYVFLEANPSPMFLYFERQTHFPITEQLVKLLVS